MAEENENDGMSIPPGSTPEDVFNLNEPTDVLLEKRDELADTYFEMVFSGLAEDYPEAEVEELNQRTFATMLGTDYEKGKEYGTVLDKAGVFSGAYDSGGFFSPSIGRMVKRSGNEGTIPAYKLQEQASKKAAEGVSYIDQVRGLFTSDPDPGTLPKQSELIEQKIITTEGELVRPPNVGERPYFVPDNETLKEATKYLAGAGAVFGGLAGSPGGVGGVLLGGVLGGAAAGGIGTAATIGVAGAASLPEDYNELDYGMDLVRRTWTVMGIPDDLASFLIVNSPEARDLIVTNVVSLAEYLGVEKSYEWREKNKINELKDISNKGSEYIRKVEEELESQDIIGPEAFIPLIAGDETVRNVVNNIGDEFFLGLREIQDEIGRTDEYKAMRSQVRKEMMYQKKEEQDLLSRAQKPTDSDWLALDKFIQVKDKISTEEEIKPQVLNLVQNLSYNQLHPSIRGEMPDLQKFKTLARTIDPNGPMMSNSTIPPNFADAVLAVHEQRSDTEIQNSINAVQLGLFKNSPGFDVIVESTMPKFETIKDWAEDTITFIDEKTGGRATRILEREGFDLTQTPVYVEGHGTLYKRSEGAEIMNWANLIMTGLTETVFHVGEKLQDLVINYGVPNEIYGESRADRAFDRGIREPGLPLVVKIDARMKSGLGGPHIAAQEIARVYGYQPGDVEYNVLSTAGFLTENINIERPIFKVLGKGLRLAGNSPYAAYAGFVARGSGVGRKIAKQELLAGVVEDVNVDPVVARQKLHEEAAVRMLNKGLNPLEKMTAAETRLFRRLALQAGLDPDAIFLAFAKSTDDSIELSKEAEKIVRKFGTNTVRTFKSSKAYKTIQSNLNRMVEEGLISPNDSSLFLAQIESQAFTAASSPNTRFFNAQEVIENLEVRLDTTDGLVRLRLDEPDGDTRFTARDGVRRSAFEYDENTGKRIITLFRSGDMGDLWSANADFMVSLMGPEFSQKLIRMFDHNVDENGVRTLTSEGSTQLSDAWQYYRRTKDSPNGYVAKLIDQLWMKLHQFYSRLRKQPGVLPKQVRQFWDVEFGELPSDRRFVEGFTEKARRRRAEAIFVSSDALERATEARPKKTKQAEGAQEMNMDEQTLRAFLGQKTQTRVEIQVDPRTGERTRIPRQVYADFYYDPLEVGRKLLSLIQVQPFRKRIAGAESSLTYPFGAKNQASVGTGGKYIVPNYRVAPIVEAAKRRLTDALGSTPDQLADRLNQRNYQKSEQGYTALYDLDGISDVTDADISAFRERIKASTQMPVGTRFDEAIDELLYTTEFLILNDRERAGLKTLLQELAASPQSNDLPLALLDPDANLKILSHNEYMRVLQVAQDIEANPLNRVDRNSIHPGYTQLFIQKFSNRSILLPMKAAFEKIAELFEVNPPRFNKKNADPALVSEWQKWTREIASIPDKLATAAEKSGLDDFLDFYKNQVDLLVPRVQLANVSALFDIVSSFSETKNKIDADALAQIRDAQRQGQPPPVSFPPVEPFDLNYIYGKLNQIQDLLDGFYGMTRAERQALNNLRTLKEKGAGVFDNNTGSIRNLSESEANIVADSIQILEIGLREKKEYVVDFAKQTFKRAIGHQQNKIDWNFTDKQIKGLYKAFYVGDIQHIKDVATTKRLGGLYEYGEVDGIIKQIIKKQSKEALEKPYGESEVMLTNVLIYMKLDEVRFGLAKRMAELGYDTSTRGLTKVREPGEAPGLDRQKYIDRIAQFINDEMQWQESVILTTEGQVLDQPLRPPPEKYGPLDSPYREHQDAKSIGAIDRDARAEASRILDSMGVKRELGQFSKVMIGDRYFLLPETMIEGLEDALSSIYTSGAASGTFGRNYGPKGTVEYSLNPDNKIPWGIQKWKDILTAAERASDLLINPRHYYRRLLIGVGGLPMVPYAVSLFVGGLSEIHLGQGARAAFATIPDFVKGPFSRALNKTTGTNVNFVAGVMARISGDGSYRPNTKPLVLRDGRILTADFVANNMEAFGFHTAFADMIADPNIHNRIEDTFKKSSVKITGAQAGAIGGLVASLLTGASGVVAGTATGAGAGLTLGWLLTRGNALDKAHRFYREAFTSIDMYQRLKVFVRELENGVDFSDAAQRTLDIKLDYGRMTDIEASYLAKAFAFWTYFAQASGLFMRSLIENPDRIVAQLKLARSTQIAATKGEDPDLMLASWDKSRIFLPFEINGTFVRLPYTSVSDTMQLLVDFIKLASSIPGTVSGDLDSPDMRESMQAIAGRGSPFLVEGIRQLVGVDPGRGFALERATNQVPALLVQLDYDIFGGALWDYLNIKFIPYDDMKKDWGFDANTGRRVNPNNLEMPARGIYIAQNPYTYSMLMNFLQTPVTGRMGRVLEALDRSNIGFTEALVKASDLYFQADREKPLLANIPFATSPGFVKERRRSYMRRPVNFGPDNLDTATGRIFMRADEQYVAPDGSSYTLEYDQYQPLEILKAFGFGYLTPRTYEEQVNRKLREQIRYLNDRVKKQPQK